jgi:alpha-ketoglutarate-dependent taurine dioxygenase
VLCIRDQRLTPLAFRDAMRSFGTPVVRTQLAQHPQCREVNVISSEDRDELGDAHADYPEAEKRLLHRIVIAGDAPQ